MGIAREAESDSGPAITGWGKCLPDYQLTNQQLIDKYGLNTTNEWILSRTGIETRGIADEITATSDMAAIAGKRALDQAKLSALDVREIIVATITPDCLTPGASSFTQEKLQAKNAAAYDLSAACSGFLYSLRLAFALTKSKMSDNILVIGADKLSTVTNWHDRGSCILFADGAGAVVVQNTNRPARVAQFDIHSDSEGIYNLYVPAGGSRQPITHTNLEKHQNTLQMEGNKIYCAAVTAMSESIEKILEQANLPHSEVGLIICHQANLKIIEAVAKKLGFYDKNRGGVSSKVYVNIARHGNTSSATIPIAITEAVEEGRLTKGMNVVLAAFGAGYTYGAGVVEWTGIVAR